MTNIAGVESRPFDADTYELEDDVVVDVDGTVACAGEQSERDPMAQSRRPRDGASRVDQRQVREVVGRERTAVARRRGPGRFGAEHVW